MNQYCRYCTDLVVADINYCAIKKKRVSDAAAKTVNHCKDFVFNPIDAFDLEKRYRPRQKKEKQCSGQMELF